MDESVSMRTPDQLTEPAVGRKAEQFSPELLWQSYRRTEFRARSFNLLPIGGDDHTGRSRAAEAMTGRQERSGSLRENPLRRRGNN